MSTRRDVLLDALSRWHAEGVIDEPTFDRLAAKAREASDAPLGQPAPDGTANRSFAAQATQFVGGLLLGAALIALVVFADLGDDASRWAMLALGAIAVAGAIVLERASGEARAGLVDAAYAAGFVPLAVAAVSVFGEDEPVKLLVSALVGAAAVGVHVMKKGRGPVIMLCAAAMSLASFGATADLFGGTEAATALAWLLLLLAYLGLMLTWRREAWSSAAAGALVIPVSIAYIMLITETLPSDVDSLVIEGLIALLLGALFALGLRLDVRGLVAASAAGLTIDAVVFAFDLGGPGTAVIVLLALGGLLVWQGAGIRAYFKRRENA